MSCIRLSCGRLILFRWWLFLIRFGFYKKNKTELEQVQTDRFWFGYFGIKQFKPVWLGFFGVFRFRFGLVFSVWFGFYKKNETEPKQVQTDRFWFGYFGTKTSSNRFGLVFFSLARFFLCFSVWVRFSFFGFRLIKPKSNRTGRFFQNFNRFFFIIRFF
jgi:hypothetical protein